MKHIALKTTLLTSIALLMACNNAPVETAASEPPTAQPQAAAIPPAPPAFHELINIYQPLGSVTGNKQPFPLQKTDAPNTLAPTIDYAQETGSYALIVIKNDKLVLEKYFGDFDETLLSESASMHKSILGLAFAAALSDGAIKSVDEPIRNYVDTLADDPRGDITIRNLLNMASGFKPLSYEGGAESSALKFMNDGPNVRNTVLNLELVTEPGTVFHYQNTISQLLCIVLEAATEQPYTDYLSTRIWQRVGADEAKVWLNEADGFPRTYASFFARPIDWARIGLLIKDQGRYYDDQIIPAAFIDEMTKPSATNPNYGWQIWLGNEYEGARFYNDAKAGFGVPASEPFAVNDMVYFDGFGGQRVYISQSENLVIVRLGDVAMTWDDTRLPNMVIEALKD